MFSPDLNQTFVFLMVVAEDFGIEGGDPIGVEGAAGPVLANLA